jgi:hypothetical protein
MRRLLVACAALMLIGGLVGMSAGASAAPKHTAAKASTAKPYGGLDCNGYSPIQKRLAPPVVQCTDIRGSADGEAFEDNGHYTGHDEPMHQFFSTTPGSGNAMQYQVTLPRDPAGVPDGSFSAPIYDGQLEVAPWFSMVVCDTQSWPEADNQTCTPDSDSNIQVPPAADHAPAAFLELQFYPPYTNSCGAQWCSALTIDSLQLNFDFSVGNFNCIEPVNFAFLTHSGTPVGPPGPDQQDASTYTQTPDVLAMDGGDRLRVTMHDTAQGIFAQVKDLTTGETGKMKASVANGFRQIIWDDQNFLCNGQPYAFHPMYDTAAPPVDAEHPRAWAAWSAHTGNISFSSEIGHAEPQDGDKDDGGCSDFGFTVCFATDKDFDGWGYHLHPALWPDGSADLPTPFLFGSPKSPDGGGAYTQTYDVHRFETDLPAVERAAGNCNTQNGDGCHYPPRHHRFYPWFHLDQVGKHCMWGLSNDLPNQIDNFGGMTQAWGSQVFTDYGGGFIAGDNFASDLTDNPCP